MPFMDSLAIAFHLSSSFTSLIIYGTMSGKKSSSTRKSQTYYPMTGGVSFHMGSNGSIRSGSASNVETIVYGSGNSTTSDVSSITTNQKETRDEDPFKALLNAEEEEEMLRDYGEDYEKEEDEDDVASTIHLKEGNSPQILLALAYGILEDDSSEAPKMICDYENDPIFNVNKTNKVTKTVKRFTPTNKQLHDEVMRRKVLFGVKGKFSSQKGRVALLKWLEGHPRKNKRDVTYLRSEVAAFKTSLKQATSSCNGSGSGQWRGDIPLLRFIHCIIDDDKIKEAFIACMRCLSREELDGRHSTEHARPDVWALVASKWNCRTFNPMTRLYPHLHSSFSDAVDCSHENVATMGECTAERVRRKWASLRAQLLIVKSNWEKSGSGEGMGELVDGDYLDVGGIGERKSDFLGKYSPVVLYLWEVSAELGFLTHVVQQIETDKGLDGDNIPSVTDLKNKRRKKAKDKDDRMNLMSESIAKGLKATSRSINEITCSLLEGQLDTLKQKRYEERMKKYMMKHSKELEPEMDALICNHISALTFSIEDLQKKIKEYKDGMSVLDNKDHADVEVIAID